MRNQAYRKITIEARGTGQLGIEDDGCGIALVRLEFSAAEFVALPQDAKKAWTLSKLEEGLGVILPTLDVPADPFLDAIERVRRDKFENVWHWGTPKSNATRSKRASIECHHELEGFRAFLVIQNRKGEEALRKLILETDPSEFSFGPKFGRFFWDGDDVVMTSKDGAEVARVLGAIENSETSEQ